MFLENVVFDATDPRTSGRSWETRLGTEQLTDDPAGFETRLAVPDGPTLDLCFQTVASEPTGPERLQLVTETTGTTGTTGTGRPEALVALRLESADPRRDGDFWAWLSGWMPTETAVPPGGAVLRHPSGRGPRLELVPERAPKADGKNRIHLDLRLEREDDPDAVAGRIAEWGGRELHPDWGDLPWRVFTDPSGNELCLLPAPH